MEHAGFTQTSLAKQLEVSKEAVSQWLKNKSFPRPNKLLKLAKILNLSFTDLVIKEEEHAPVIAFRKRQGTKTKDHHVEKAQDMGRFLRALVPYLPFDTLEMPPVLKSPVCEYDYLIQVTDKVRSDIKLDEKAVVDFPHLIQRFIDLQAVIVPVMWGAKKRHENALHIYLPDSRTTWIYLNLDVNVHDFKFWMAHELGHCLSPGLRGEEAEDFADAFAGMLLFSEYKAEKAYNRLIKVTDLSQRMNKLVQLAEKEVISPYTVYLQINKFASASKKPELKLEAGFYSHITRLNKQYKNVSEILFDQEEIKPKRYIKEVRKAFGTPFFDVLKGYLKEDRHGAGFIQAVMDMPLLDARGFYDELI